MYKITIWNKIRKVWLPTQRPLGPPWGRGPSVEKHWPKGTKQNLAPPKTCLLIIIQGTLSKKNRRQKAVKIIFGPTLVGFSINEITFHVGRRVYKIFLYNDHPRNSKFLVVIGRWGRFMWKCRERFVKIVQNWLMAPKPSLVIPEETSYIRRLEA